MIAQYKALALRTEKPLPTPDARLRHAALGLITETGELVTEIKRFVIYGKPLDDARRKHMAEEIGDAFWYLAISTDVIGTDMFSTYLADVSMAIGYTSADLERQALILGLTVGKFAAAVDSGDGRSVEAVQIAVARALCVVACIIGIPVHDILADNIAKLRERFPDAYSNEAAEARADKDGADARNS